MKNLDVKLWDCGLNQGDRNFQANNLQTSRVNNRADKRKKALN